VCGVCVDFRIRSMCRSIANCARDGLPPPAEDAAELADIVVEDEADDRREDTENFSTVIWWNDEQKQLANRHGDCMHRRGYNIRIVNNSFTTQEVYVSVVWISIERAMSVLRRRGLYFVVCYEAFHFLYEWKGSVSTSSLHFSTARFNTTVHSRNGQGVRC